MTAAVLAAAVPPPPASIECTVGKLAAGTVLHRIHDGRFGPTQFNPGLGNSRFAPFELRGAKVPTAYAATSLSCAVFETIFHDIEPGAPFKSVYWSALEPLRYSTLELQSEISLAQLYSADLMRWGLERRHLIDTPKANYPETRAWVLPIHESSAAPEGMIWVSRRFDEDRALLLFGSRVDPAILKLVASVEVTGDPAVLAVVHALASRADIDIIR
ncbi:MAG TPA: RES family NAD+ phosphorylase [Allosphingosinicella sp.]|nr:RES family NAD+ phosphorylase [Allosphingosinicella sp.]